MQRSCRRRCRGGRSRRGPRALRGAGAAPVGAMVPATGRYAVQGAQVRAGQTKRRTASRLVVEDDASRPERAARLHADLLRAAAFVLGRMAATRRARSPRPARAPWSGTTAPPRTTSSAFPASSRCPLRRAATWWLSDARSLRFGPAPRSPSWPRAAPSRALPARRSSARLPRSASGSRPSPFATRPPRSPRPGPTRSSPADRTVGRWHSSAPWQVSSRVACWAGCRPAWPPFRSCSAVTRRASSPRSSGTRSSAPRRSSGRLPEMLADARATGSGELDYVATQAYAMALVATRCLELEPGAAARRGARAPRPLRRLRARSRKRSPARPPPRGHPLEYGVGACSPARNSRSRRRRLGDSSWAREGHSRREYACRAWVEWTYQRHPTPARRPGASAAKVTIADAREVTCPTVVPAGRATAPSAAPLCSRSAANWRAADAPQLRPRLVWPARIERGRLPCSGEQARPAGARREASSGGREYARVLSVPRHAPRRRGHHDVRRARGRGDRPRAFAPRASSPTTA